MSVISLPDKIYGKNITRGLPSLSGNGAYLQHGHHFYELQAYHKMLLITEVAEGITSLKNSKFM